MQSQWDNTQHGVEARLHQLDNMIGHSNHWEERRKEVTALVGHSEGRFHSLLQQSARDPLTKQLADNKVRDRTSCCPLGEPPLPRHSPNQNFLKVSEVLDAAGQGGGRRVNYLSAASL